jgi:hypothetical protein
VDDMRAIERNGRPLGGARIMSLRAFLVRESIG